MWLWLPKLGVQEQLLVLFIKIILGSCNVDILPADRVKLKCNRQGHFKNRSAFILPLKENPELRFLSEQSWCLEELLLGRNVLCDGCCVSGRPRSWNCKYRLKLHVLFILLLDTLRRIWNLCQVSTAMQGSVRAISRDLLSWWQRDLPDRWWQKPLSPSSVDIKNR